MLWGEPQMDLSASHANKQLDMFVSWKPHQDALHTDAFSFNWKEYYFYPFPPSALNSRALQKVKLYGAKKGYNTATVANTDMVHTGLLHEPFAKGKECTNATRIKYILCIKNFNS